MNSVVHYRTLISPIYEGFEDVEASLACFSDHQIFERFHKYQLKSSLIKKQKLSLKELTQMEVGDLVTHIDHGIGRFGGLKKIEVEGKSGGDLVKVILSGNYELKSIIISEKAKKEEQDIITDLIIAAYNNAKENLKKKSAEELSKITGGIDLPLDFKLPF